MAEPLIQSFFLIFSGAAILASLAMFGKQPLLVAYIALGALLGPHGLQWVNDVQLLGQMASIGIIFLLFLLGLDMQPQALFRVLRQVTHITLFSSVVFAAAGFAISWAFNFSTTESLIVGAAMMFSSTIIGIKLLPTTVLHHRRSGEIMVGMLLMQDFLAIFVLMLLLSNAEGAAHSRPMWLSIISLPLLVGGTVLCVRYLLLPLFIRFDRIGEYVFLLAIGWCLGVAEISEHVGLSREIGAFIAGISLATSPIAQYIALSLKPLRDFFLILFFFSLGGGFDLSLIPHIALPAVILGLVMLGLKPLTFQFLIKHQTERKDLAWDVGFRLGQISEFSLLIAYVAYNSALISNQTSHLIQAAAIITFLVSSYIVVFNFPNPIAVSDRLRRD